MALFLCVTYMCYIDIFHYLKTLPQNDLGISTLVLQPFCDGSHKSLPEEVGKYQPYRFQVSASKSYMICLCRKTKKPPFCDGSHKQKRATD